MQAHGAARSLRERCVGRLVVHRLIDLEARFGLTSMNHDIGQNAGAVHARTRALCSNNKQAGQSGVTSGEDQ
jgi:hypothetical protein